MITEAEVQKIISSEFKDCLKSLSQISWDPVNEIALVDKKDRFHHYDIMAEKFYGDKPKSPDMLLFHNETLVFVEFKNGKIGSKEKDKIKLKAIEGCFIILFKIISGFKKDIGFTDIFKLKKSYILVYDTDKNTRERIRDRKHANLARFGLEHYNGTFFHQVSTLSRDIFIQWLHKRKLIKKETGNDGI